MPHVALIFVLLLAATFAIAWVGGMDYQRLRAIDRSEGE